ncbi:ThiF family adenylyltransferase [Klenkia taihuensis]|uniref:ThiF family protein n=1 Tax=Klenkia taihuensis TaxID=1225127 RepID=A0A1I1K795_9ACTN|nr:ThiF family adenylyltransferase [Klenkia taihuensis]GHE10464.1 thiamin biosynthesis protein [Klenkia taihuensis]SFC56465.1 ThiF family protein [Klenkia taihuensis]
MTDSDRPLLLPGTPVLRVDPASVQVGGTDGDPGVQVGPLPPGAADAVAALVRGLDGGRTTRAVLAGAVADALDPVVVGELLTGLRAGGRLVDLSTADLVASSPSPAARARDAADVAAAVGAGGAGAWARRRVAAVVVDGANRVGVPLAALLAASGVGRVHVRDRGAAVAADAVVGGLSAADEGRPRTLAAADAVRRAAPGVDLRPLPAGSAPDLLVLTRPWSALDPVPVHGERGPHLVATVRGPVGVVGPLVVPGRTACLRCAQLHRTDADPGWPALAGQLHAPGDPAGAGGAALCLATALTALGQVLAHLDGSAAPAALEATLELRAPDLLPRRRGWPPHPACGCRPGTRPPPAPAGPSRRAGPRPGTLEG